jgi:replicative DNA helicase
MNIMPRGDAFVDTIPEPQEWVSVEQGILAACLLRPEAIAEVSAKLVPDDFQNKFHRQILSALVDLYDQKRQPSIEALAARFADDEIEAGLTVRQYLKKMFSYGIANRHRPLADLIETARDQALRRYLTNTGTVLAGQAANGAMALGEVAAHAVEQIDDVLSALHQGQRRSYDAEEAGAIALRHLDSTEKPYPTTGLKDLDRMTGGWPRGQMSVLAGRPGMGKSAAASSSLLRGARAGHASLFFSLEMVGEQLGSRMLTDLAWTRQHPIHYEDILHRRTEIINDPARRRLAVAKDELAKLPVLIEEQRGLTFAEIAARSRKAANALDRQGRRLETIFVDHMLLVHPSARYSGNRVQEVREISGGLATLAKELDVAVVALCQLNRGVVGR